MRTKIGMGISICVLSFAISILLLSHVCSARPIFGKCIDGDLSAILKVITVSLNRNRRINPINEIEANGKVENIMRMIKKYLTADRMIHESMNGPSRKFFFWPFTQWPLSFVPTNIFGGVGGSIYGGMGPNGFSIGGGLNGELHGNNGEKPQSD